MKYRRLLGVVCALAAAGIGSAHDGGPDGFVRFEGKQHFQTGELTNLEIHPWSEQLFLGTTQEGAFLPVGAFVSPWEKTDGPFDTMQVGYGSEKPDQSDVEVFVRARDLGSRANSRWYRVEREGEVVFEQAFAEIQYMVRLTSFDPETSPSFTFFSAELGLHHDGDAPAPRFRQHVAVPKPAVVDRAAWGARPPSSSYVPHSPNRLVVHHTTSPTAAEYKGEASIRGIQNFHMDTRGWIDIAYHFIVGPDGRIFEGRPPGMTGAHVVPNTDKVGVCVLGNFMPGAEVPTQAQQDSLVSILAWLSSTYDIEPISRITGHRDWMSTDCPGDVLYGMLPAIRTAVKARLDGTAPLQAWAPGWLGVRDLPAAR